MVLPVVYRMLTRASSRADNYGFTIKHDIAGDNPSTDNVNPQLPDGMEMAFDGQTISI